MRKHVRRHALALCLAALCCGLLALWPGPPLRLASSTALLPLAESSAGALRTAFGAAVPVSAMGSAFAVSAVARGTADLALSDFPYRLRGMLERPLAELQLAAVAGEGPPRDLRLRDLRRLLRGDVRNWRQLGGADLAVRLILRTPGSGVLVALYGFAGGRLRRGQVAALSNGQVLRLVRAIPGALGFVESHYAPRSLTLRVGGRRPGQPGYPLHFTGYVLYHPQDGRAALAAAILRAVAQSQGMAP